MYRFFYNLLDKCICTLYNENIGYSCTERKEAERMYLSTNVQELKQRREAAGLSMKGLSKRAGLPDNAVLRIESGQTRRINHLRAREIAKALHCKVEDIFNDTKGA